MSDISYVETMLAIMPRSSSWHIMTWIPVESTISQVLSLGHGEITESLDELRGFSTKVLLELSDELLDSLLTLEELSFSWLDELSTFSEELL